MHLQVKSDNLSYSLISYFPFCYKQLRLSLLFISLLLTYHIALFILSDTRQLRLHLRIPFLLSFLFSLSLFPNPQKELVFRERKCGGSTSSGSFLQREREFSKAEQKAALSTKALGSVWFSLIHSRYPLSPVSSFSFYIYTCSHICVCVYIYIYSCTCTCMYVCMWEDFRLS